MITRVVVCCARVVGSSATVSAPIRAQMKSRGRAMKMRIGSDRCESKSLFSMVSCYLKGHRILDLDDLGHDGDGDLGRCLATQRQTHRAVQSVEFFSRQIEVFGESLFARSLVAPRP